MATLTGILLGLSILILAVWSGGSLMVFVDLPSLLIVLGGTLAATLVSFRFETVLNVFRVSLRLFRKDARIDTEYAVERLVELSHLAGQDSILALEQHAKEESDPFIAMGLALLLKNAPPERIERRYAIEIDGARARHARGIRMFGVMAKLAPSFGLVGTLLGLVMMLQDIKADLSPDTLGPSMALAMITTLYGALLAFLFFLPAAEKLRDASAREIAHIVMVRDGILMIRDNYQTRELEQMLNAHLPPRRRQAILDRLVMRQETSSAP